LSTPLPVLIDGPGTELKKLLEQLGFTDSSGCGCDKRAAQMNLWGVAGCQENRDMIIGWLHDQAGTFERLLLKIVDPVPWLVDEAIKRAESKAATKPLSESPTQPVMR
jgi:hypothetical protein